MTRLIGCLGIAWVVCLMTVPGWAATVAVRDQAGRSVEVGREPSRIVCLGPGSLRLIVYLGAVERVCGVESLEKRDPAGRPYRLAHPELAALPSVGPGGPAAINKKPDMETLLRVRPQVIFVTYMEAPLADEVQRSLGIPVVVLSYGELGTFDTEVFHALRIAGRVLGCEGRAEAVIAGIESWKLEVERRALKGRGSKPVRVYVGGIGHRGAHGIESTERDYLPLEWAKAHNVAEDIPAHLGSHVFLDKEMLLTLDPDVIFIDGGGKALILEDYAKRPKVYEALRAFRSRRVYLLHPYNSYSTNLGTALTDAYAIGKALYPDAFAGMDPETKADEIYSFLVGKPVYALMKEIYGPLGGVVLFDN